MEDIAAKIPWIEKHRAHNLDKIIGHDDHIMIITNLIEKEALINMLFYGEPGTGKTSMILAIARKLYGSEYKSYIKEINASSDRGIDTIRTTIKDYVKLKSKKMRLLILDEIDAMTVDAQGALRGIIDDYSKNNRFCLICNNIEKIIPALKSRCLPFKFNYPNKELILIKLKEIAHEEKIDISDESIKVLAECGKDLRQIINLLQGISCYSEECITPDIIYLYLGINIGLMDEFYKDLEKKELTFNDCYTKGINMIKSGHMTLKDLVQYIFMKLDLHNMKVIKHLSKIEYRLRNGGDTEINLAYLISLFIL